VTEKRSLKLVVGVRPQPQRVFHCRAQPNATNRPRVTSRDGGPHLRTDCSFIVLDQTRQHRTEQADECRACREDRGPLQAHIEPQPKHVRRPNDTTES